MKQSERPSYKAWYAANRERLITKAAARNKALGNVRTKYCREYYHKTKTPERMAQLAERQKTEYWKDPERYRKYAKDSRARLRQEFFIAYGNECACCHETEQAFLTLEHKNRDGAAHRKAVGHTSTEVLRDLRKRGWPKDDYEILCFNCNRATHEQGICPHRRNTE